MELSLLIYVSEMYLSEQALYIYFQIKITDKKAASASGGYSKSRLDSAKQQDVTTLFSLVKCEKVYLDSSFFHFKILNL